MTRSSPCGAALLVGGAALALVACGDPTPAPAAATHDWSADPRLTALLAPCPQLGHFDGDTSDLVPVLVGKLSTAQLDVLRHLREELSGMGDAVLEPLAAYVDRYYTDRFGVPALRNATAVLRLSDAAGGREILRRCLEHPHEDVRAAAAAGLAVHGGPEDYEPLSYLLAPGVSGESTRATVLTAMYHADPARLVRDALGWFREGQHTDLWLDAARCVSDVPPSPETLAAVEALLEDFAGERARTFLLATLARGGDEEALTELRALLGASDPDVRTRTLEAFVQAGDVRELVPVLQDADPVLRARAASILAESLPQDWAHAALLGALGDRDLGVRRTALEALLGIGEPRAQDDVLALFAGDRRDLESALLPVREAWEANPGLAERAAQILLRRLAELDGLPLGEQKAWLQALGQVPDPTAAEFLLERARGAQGELDKLPARRWIARQIGNTAVGRELVREAWRSEEDLELRFDLLEAASFGRDDVTREFLFEVLDAPRSTPFEGLYCADRLARQGPSSVVAPVLKRAALRQTHPQVRPALDCLMWRWYGPAS